eukprot:jgi/Chrzof1/8610/Cz03g17090.t1
MSLSVSGDHQCHVTVSDHLTGRHIATALSSRQQCTYMIPSERKKKKERKKKVPRGCINRVEEPPPGYWQDMQAGMTSHCNWQTYTA